VIHFSEQGPNSKSYTPNDLTEQAASLAYVWKKMKALDGIETFQYHFWRDFRGEGGLRLGLRRFPDDIDAPSGKKPIWNLLSIIGYAEGKRSLCLCIAHYRDK